MESVERYLREMKFKRRVFGGIDEENALLHIQKICELYKAELKEMQSLREAAAEAQRALKAAQEAPELRNENMEKRKSAEKEEQRLGNEVGTMRRQKQENRQENEANHTGRCGTHSQDNPFKPLSGQIGDG